MTITAQLTFIRDAIDAWAATQKGRAYIALDMIHLFELLGEKPGGFRCAVHFTGETKRGDFEEAGQVDRHFWVGLSWGKSLQANTGDIMVKADSGGAQPMGEIAGQLRQIIRALQFDPATTEVTPDYRGMYPLKNINPYFTVDGLYLEFWIGTQLPPPGGQ